MIRLELSTTLAFILYFIVLLDDCKASPSVSVSTSTRTPSILDLIKTAVTVESTGTDARDIPCEYVFSTTFEKVPLSLQMKIAPADLNGLTTVKNEKIAPEVLSAYGKRVNIPATYKVIETGPADIYNCFKNDRSEVEPTDLLIKRTPIYYKESGNGKPLIEFFYQTYMKKTRGTDVFYKRISANDNLLILRPEDNV